RRQRRERVPARAGAVRRRLGPGVRGRGHRRDRGRRVHLVRRLRGAAAGPKAGRRLLVTGRDRDRPRRRRLGAAAPDRRPDDRPGRERRRPSWPSRSESGRDPLVTIDALIEGELERFRREHPRSAELYERARGSLFGGVPMPWMMLWAGGYPVAVE